MLIEGAQLGLPQIGDVEVNVRVQGARNPDLARRVRIKPFGMEELREIERITGSRKDRIQAITHNRIHVVQAGQVNALGQVDEVLRRIVAAYRRQEKAGVLEEALAWLDRQFKVTK